MRRVPGAVGHDLATRRRVHPVYLLAGSAMVAVHMAELFFSGSAAWLHIARLLLGEAAR